MIPNENLGADDPSDDSLPLRELHRLAGGVCCDCLTPYSPRDVVFSVVLGLKNAPRCLPCLSRRLELPQPELHAHLLEYIQRRECYGQAWRMAEQMEATLGSSGPSYPKEAEIGLEVSAEPQDALFWDAGDMACGELVLGLRKRLDALAPGLLLTVRATDPAAPEDLPAWCRLTGHNLVSSNHPSYVIRRKGD